VLRRRHHSQEKTAGKKKEGKKRMRSLGSVSVPQEAFMAVLKLDELLRHKNARRDASSRRLFY
jgi:hypothetical protein